MDGILNTKNSHNESCCRDLKGRREKNLIKKFSLKYHLLMSLWNTKEKLTHTYTHTLFYSLVVRLNIGNKEKIYIKRMTSLLLFTNLNNNQLIYLII